MDRDFVQIDWRYNVDRPLYTVVPLNFRFFL